MGYSWLEGNGGKESKREKERQKEIRKGRRGNAVKGTLINDKK
jgi:hypothetical protein